ncbi:adiponectin receptor protein 1-like [Stylophora pistillata]|uniref:Adiponectin receptor protein n=1 Tax=Stylophora pistillata TaxID=50429 RepID=A0A2B4RJY8_STYPI|nr:adiponectin receptor protein 1-like [Stylophora pistillata]PFX18714.1 Adiponectin receptor protein [Stylophora pistillata]
MAELRRRRPNMSEVKFVDKEYDENSGIMSEITETTDEVVEKTEGLGEDESLLTLESQTADKTSLELASVDVTVESKGTENEKESVSSEEADTFDEEDPEKVTLIEKSEATRDDVSAEVDGEDDKEEDDDDNIEDETVTCSLLGLEQAKVFIVKGEENLHVMFQTVKGNVQDTAVRIKGNVHDAAEKMHDNMHEAAEKVHVMIKSTKDNMSDAAERVQEILKTAKDNVQESMHEAADKAERISKKAIELARSGWYLLAHIELPEWLRDNDFLSHHHRPPMPSFRSCFKSIFKVHSETGNIWTHLIGFVAFICITFYMFLRPITSTNPFPKDWQEKLVFGAFFTGAILCLGFSWIFHTVYCHSITVSKIFSRLDYSGIALLIMGSFIPPLYYGFYCSRILKIIYMSLILTLGILCIIVSLWSKFSTPKYRGLRAGLFLTFGCSGIVPAIHFIVAYGVTLAHRQASIGWMALMGVLYIIGAIMYATRVPERFFPGKCDIWFQSHQIFHVLVLGAALVHLYGICQMAYYRFDQGAVCEQ